MLPRIAAETSSEYLGEFLGRCPTREEEAITTCAILECLSPNETTPDFCSVVSHHRAQRRAARRVFEALGSNGLFALACVAQAKFNNAHA